MSKGATKALERPTSGYHRGSNGALQRVKNSASAANSRPATKYVSHGGRSGLLTDRLDLRSRLGRLYQLLLVRSHSWLSACLGRTELTALEAEDADDLARLQLLKRVAWAAVREAIDKNNQEARATAAAEFARARREAMALRDRYQGMGQPLPNPQKDAAQRALRRLSDDQVEELLQLMMTREQHAAQRAPKPMEANRPAIPTKQGGGESILVFPQSGHDER
jgi:hypothetical protein